jgi:YgiT-type zinc finger domain-containing protein
MDQLAGKERLNMIPFEKCPVCSGKMVEKEVEKLLRGGGNTAVLKIKAEVCLHCGERLYSQETVRRFEQIRAKLKRHETSDFQPLGQSFEVL